MTAEIEVGVLHVRATLNGVPLGDNFRTEREARGAVLRAMRNHYGLIPRDGDEAYLNPKERT